MIYKALQLCIVGVGMQHTDNSKKTHILDVARRRLWLLIVGLAVLLLIIFVIVAASSPGDTSRRSESYKDVSGAAGLDASITYDCKDNCEQKYNFNVYILGGDGQQVAVVRPDKDGKVQLALPEGNYVMLIGKQFGKDKLFPQEPLALKNGKALELKLHYR